MGDGRRGATIVIAVSVMATIVSVAVSSLRVTTPSSGSAIQSGPQSFPPDGVVVGVLSGATTTLRDGDVVVGMGGHSTLAWAGTSTTEPLAAPTGGDLVPFELRRDGGTITLDVATEPYPLGPMLLDWWGSLLFVVALFAIALFVFTRRPTDPAAGALLLTSVGGLGSTVPYLLGQDPLDLATGRFVPFALATAAIYGLLWAGLIDFTLVFPRPFATIARRPFLRLVPYVAMAALYGGALAFSATRSSTTLAWFGTWGPSSLLLTVAAFVAAPPLLVLRWRHASADERGLLRGFALVLAFTIVADLVIWVIPEAVSGVPLVPSSISALTGLPFVIVLGVAIVRRRAFDIDVVVRRSLVYGGLTIAVVVVYALAAAVLGTILGSAGGFATPLLATGIAVVAALPIRDVLQRAASRVLFGDRDEPVRAIRRLGDRLDLSVDPEAMPRIVVDTVADALRLTYVGFELGIGPGARLAAERGTRPPNVQERPLAYQGRPIGRLLVGPRGRSEPLTAADLMLLEDLGRQVGVIAHAALLTDDLRTSRERLVAAREEERRRLRRDLHDGLGPTLAGIAMRAAAAEALLRDDPDGATRLLVELQAESADAVADVRRLVDGLRPPAIDEVGLVGALQRAAVLLETPGAPRLSVEADGDLPVLPAAVEVAAYRIGTEAMTNAVRHAGAGVCSVRLAGGDALTVVVEDDGKGVPPSHAPGVGMASMHERAAELGGAVVVEPRPGGGTRVIARLPLVAHQSSAPA